MLALTEALAVLTGEALYSKAGQRRFGKHSWRATGAVHLSLVGLATSKIQLLGRWLCAIALRYCRFAPIADIARDYKSASSSSRRERFGHLHRCQSSACSIGRRLGCRGHAGQHCGGIEPSHGRRPCSAAGRRDNTRGITRLAPHYTFRWHGNPRPNIGRLCPPLGGGEHGGATNCGSGATACPPRHRPRGRSHCITICNASNTNDGGHEYGPRCCLRPVAPAPRTGGRTRCDRAHSHESPNGVGAHGDLHRPDTTSTGDWPRHGNGAVGPSVVAIGGASRCGGLAYARLINGVISAVDRYRYTRQHHGRE